MKHDARADMRGPVVLELQEMGLLQNVTHFKDEITLEVSKAALKKALAVCQNNFGYLVLMDLTAVDYLQPPSTKVVYLLHNPHNFNRLRFVCFTERGGSVPSVIELFAGAYNYEREVFDLFGVSFDGHPKLTRIMLPDDWQGHPLRKDYALKEESVEFKHGAQPKVPSEIIPHVKRYDFI